MRARAMAMIRREMMIQAVRAFERGWDQGAYYHLLIWAGAEW